MYLELISRKGAKTQSKRQNMHFPFDLPTNKPFDAVGFGLNAVDHLIVVPEYPAFDTKMRLLEHKQSAGGQTATAMVALQRLGFRTAYAGRFGSDPEGRFGLETLKDDGVNVDFAEVVEGARNQVAFITIDVRNGERTIVWDRDERLAYLPDEAPVEFGTTGRVLHLDAHDPPACLRMARVAGERRHDRLCRYRQCLRRITRVASVYRHPDRIERVSASRDRHTRRTRRADRVKDEIRLRDHPV